VKALYVLSSHWDREWHQSFQIFRYRMVRMLDGVLDAQQRSELSGPFYCDGQVSFVDDYMDVRPERANELRARLASGDLVAGPWYTQPDELLVSGESLIRNLEMGMRRVQELGGRSSTVGFACDAFGHAGQMPQIFAGFGITTAFIWRGANTADHRNILWRGADGTVLPTYRFGTNGYWGYCVNVRSFPQQMKDLSQEEFAKALEAYLEKEAACTQADAVLLFDGPDHALPDMRLYRMLQEYAARPGGKWQIEHVSLDVYAAELLKSADKLDVVVEGERTESASLPQTLDQQWLIVGTASSRVWIKQANTSCQSLLCQWAEPFSAWAQLEKRQTPQDGFLQCAWKYLILNHAHDSICGCSVDDVHEDMAYRFRQCRDIAQSVIREALTSVVGDSLGEVSDKRHAMALFNPLPRSVDEVVEFDVDAPADWPMADLAGSGSDKRPLFTLTTEDGKAVAFQRVSQQARRSRVTMPDDKALWHSRVVRTRVAARVNLPAMGYRVLSVTAGTASDPVFGLDRKPSLLTCARRMENGLLVVEVETDGTVSLTDRRTGERYKRLFEMEDVADKGDGWRLGTPANDQQWLFSGNAVAVINDGPLQATLRLRSELRVPRRYSPEAQTRSEELVSVRVEHDLVLRAGASRLEITTVVYNDADDHRLRVLFPTGVSCDHFYTDAPFDVVKRSIALGDPAARTREPELETRTQQSWTAVCDAGRGLAVVTDGLMETAVRDFADRPLALTLLRGFPNTPFTDGEPGGQIRGKMTFRYWLTPLAGVLEPVELCSLGQQCHAGIRAMQFMPLDVRGLKSTPKTRVGRSFLEVGRTAVLSSLRWTGTSTMTVRLYNPSAEKTTTTLTLGADMSICQAMRVDFTGEEWGGQLPIDNTTVSVALKPKEIVTVRLQVQATEDPAASAR
jgi:alpha-mannosidase